MEIFLKNFQFNQFKFFSCFFIFITLLTGYEINNDLWFILTVGREIEASGGIYLKDMLSMHSSMDVLLQQWLYAAIAWKVYSVSGFFGIWLITEIIGLVTIYFFYRTATLISDNKFYSLLLTIIIGFFFSIYIVTRPFAVTNLLLILEVFFLENYAQKGNYKYLLPLPIISILLVNIHGAMWIFFVCVTVPYLIDVVAPKRFHHSSSKPLPLLIVLVASVLLALFNPYGAEIFKYIMMSLGGKNHLISEKVNEMLPFSFKEKAFLPMSVLMLSLLYGYIKKEFQVRYLILSIGFTLLPFIAIRGAAQFYLLACLPLAYLYKDVTLPEKFYDTKLTAFITPLVVSFLTCIFFKNRIAGVDKGSSYIIEVVMNNGILILSPIILAVVVMIIKRKKNFANIILAVSMSLVIAISTILATFQGGECKYSKVFETVIEHSSSNNEQIILYAEYFTGAYAEFLGLKPYIDPRAEAFVPEINHEFNYLEEYFEVKAGRIIYTDFIDKYQFNYLCVSDGNSLYYYLERDPAYEELYNDDKMKIKVFHRKKD